MCGSSVVPSANVMSDSIVTARDGIHLALMCDSAVAVSCRICLCHPDWHCTHAMAIHKSVCVSDTAL
eukprot:9755539-Ditylum_brightwellii.AAC.1